jgi:hypothetical protein
MTNGLVVQTPTTINVSGTATIEANGSVSFSAITLLRLNGVFTADYDNYMITWSGTSSGNTNMGFRFSKGGSDNSSSTYLRRYVTAQSTSTYVYDGTYSQFYMLGSGGTWVNGQTAYIFRPQVNVTSAVLVQGVYDGGATYYSDFNGLHLVVDQFDGFSLAPTGGHTVTGSITVFGFNQ